MGIGSVSALCCYVSVFLFIWVPVCKQTASLVLMKQCVYKAFSFLFTFSTFLMAFSEYSLKFLVTPFFFKWTSTVLI